VTRQPTDKDKNNVDKRRKSNVSKRRKSDVDKSTQRPRGLQKKAIKLNATQIDISIHRSAAVINPERNPVLT